MTQWPMCLTITSRAEIQGPKLRCGKGLVQMLRNSNDLYSMYILPHPDQIKYANIPVNLFETVLCTE